MALARVELGAILATFDAHPEPFSVAGPSAFEWDAYRDLLLDDAEAHFWSLSQDPALERIAELRPGQEILAYIRRLTVALHLLHAAAQARRDTLTGVQFAELVEQDKQLSQVRGAFRLKVAALLAANDRSFAAGLAECCRLLDRQTEELSDNATDNEPSP